jgi:ribosomal protein S14
MSRFKSIAARWLPPVLVPKAWNSSFEGANWSPRRGTVPGYAPTDARQELTAGVRSELVRKSRYLHKNSGFVRELVANMAIYSTGDGIRVQAQSADPGWNRKAEAYFAYWSARCEVTGRRRAFLRRFRLSRITFRELALAGKIPGVTKSSW